MSPSLFKIPLYLKVSHQDLRNLRKVSFLEEQTERTEQGKSRQMNNYKYLYPPPPPRHVRHVELVRSDGQQRTRNTCLGLVLCLPWDQNHRTVPEGGGGGGEGRVSLPRRRPLGFVTRFLPHERLLNRTTTSVRQLRTNQKPFSNFG